MATNNEEDPHLQRIRRIADVEKEPLEYLAAITGYERKPEVSIEEAVKTLDSVVTGIKSQAYSAKMHCDENFALKVGLTRDQAASIRLYTMTWEPMSLYRALNDTLREKDRSKLIPWFLYLKLLFGALDRLPPTTMTRLFRGTKKDLSAQYVLGKTVVWWAFSSSSAIESVAESEEFFGRTGKRTKFIIDCNSGKDIRNMSYFPAEDEILILAATEFKVIEVLQPEPDVHVVYLKEVESPEPLRAPLVILVSNLLHN